MDLERERGITIKAQTARMYYTAADGLDYVLNLIDTPGHVDFSYEVSRALQACEGAVLVVDAAQGIEAQTLANAYMALESDLAIVPVVNKIDLPSADPDRVAEEIEEVIGIDAADVLQVSAKEGRGISELLERIVRDIPPPAGDSDAPLRALVFDSWFDPYVGAVMLVRVMDGRLTKGMRIQMMARWNRTGDPVTQPDRPAPPQGRHVECGRSGSGHRGNQDSRGDPDRRYAHRRRPPRRPRCLSGFRVVKSMVFSGLYPVDAEDYDGLKMALQKLRAQ